MSEQALKSVQYQFIKLGPLTLRDPKKRAKLFWSSSFYLESKISENNKQHYEKKKKSQNVLHVILGALVGSRKEQKFFPNDPIHSEGDFYLKHIEYFQTKEFCQKVLKLVQDLLVGSEDAGNFLNEHATNVCQLTSNISVFGVGSYSHGIYNLNNFKLISVDCFWRID